MEDITPHWVVITGISNFTYDNPEQWKYVEGDQSWGITDYFSEENWVRVYNPFDNETEYYLWSDFAKAWVRDGSFIGKVDRRPLLKPRKFGGCE